MLNISQKAKNALLAPSRYIKFRLEVYFDGEDNPPTDITHDVISFDTIEEVTSSTSLPFGGASYNELSVVLDNLDKAYTISNTSGKYTGKLVANKKVVLTYLIETEDDVFEEVPGGVFYTDAWASNNEALTATLTCYDILALYGDNPINRFKPIRNISFKEAYELIFTCAGVSSDMYIIDKSVVGTIDYFWCTQDTLVKMLDDLSLHTMTNVYVNRRGKIVVSSISTSYETDTILSDDSLIYSSVCNPSYSNMYSGIGFNYSNANISNNSLLSGYTITVRPGKNYINEVFSTSPVLHISSITVKAASGVHIESYEYTDKSIALNLNNTNDFEVTATIDIAGSVINTVDVYKCITSDTTAVNNIMAVTLPFICDASYINYYFDNVMGLYNSFMPSAMFNIRGLPYIELLDDITVDSETSSMLNKACITRVHSSFLEGLTSDITVRVSDNGGSHEL